MRRQWLSAVSCSLFLVALAPAPISADVYWVYPSLNIQDVVNQSESGDTVFVMPGTYSGPRNRNIRLVGREILLTSFAGPRETIIDCGGDSRAFILDEGETSATIISGFTVANGYGGSTGGGGILIDGGSPQILDCLFRNCYAPDNSFPWQPGLGGGIHITGVSEDVHIEGCTFAHCRAGVGSAVFAETVYSSFTLDRCLFIDLSGGSVLWNNDYADRCVFFATGGSPGVSPGADVIVDVDPLICIRGSDAPYLLCSDSLCLPENNPWGVLVGAMDVGCGQCGTAVERSSWGAIKAMYR